MPTRALIIDDEPLARDRIRSLLQNDERIHVVGEAADGNAALALIEDEAPDLIFLDIQMPERTGIEILAELRASDNKLPSVIFVTAYDNYAVKAFDLHAIDYLLKPFDRQRFEAAVDKALTQLAQVPPDDLAQKLALILSDLRRDPKRQIDRLSIKTDGRVLLVRLDEVDWIGAANNYVEIHVGSACHLMRETLTQLETQLDPDRFLRISRSTIVAIDRIREIQPLFHGEHAVLLSSGAKLTATRSYREALKPFLGK